jgi:SnoaL-like domain
VGKPGRKIGFPDPGWVVGVRVPGYNGGMSDAVRIWMEKYIAAWNTNEPEDIRALFTEDAVYATRPEDKDPWRGREEIVDRWLKARDEPDEWTFDWTLLGTDGLGADASGADASGANGGLVFVQGFTHYLGDRPSYDNLWVIRLEPDGRASRFTEWFMERSV